MRGRRGRALVPLYLLCTSDSISLMSHVGGLLPAVPYYYIFPPRIMLVPRLTITLMQIHHLASPLCTWSARALQRLHMLNQSDFEIPLVLEMLSTVGWLIMHKLIMHTCQIFS
ncbi:hypothetical protein B0H10DRAFT_2026226 [Mycena sp. CBHHK59/15]|nr:hypothetical protein B0H10DRAFT_2026226 [Mycena sp. CBHHK59/15]